MHNVNEERKGGLQISHYKGFAPVLVRVITLIFTFIANLTVANILQQQRTMNVFVLFMAISTLPVFMSFLDFGIGQIVFKEITRPKTDLSMIVEKLNACVRGLTVISSSLFFTNSLIFVLGIYSHLVREDTLTQRLIYFSAINLLIATIPFLVGARILLGVQKISLVIIVQGSGTLLTGVLIYLVNHSFDAVPEVIAILPAVLFFLGNFLLFRLAQREYKITILKSDSTLKSSYFFLVNQRKVMIWSSLLSASSNFFWMYPRFVLQKKVDAQDIVDFSFVILFIGSMQSLIGAYMAGKIPVFRSLDSQQNRKVFTYRAILEILLICAGLLVGLYLSVLISERQHLKFLTFHQMELLIPIFIVWSCLAFLVASRTEKDDLRFIFMLNLVTTSLVILYQFCLQEGFSSVEEFTYFYFLPILLLQLIGLIAKFQFGIGRLKRNFEPV